MSADTSGARSLKTAATVLRALRLIGLYPAGLSAAELGDRLGKSAATARYMVNTLCEGGYVRRDPCGRYQLAESPPWGPWVAPEGSGATADLAPGESAPGAVLAEAVTDLYRRTRQRSYLVRRSGTVVATVADVRGHQGLARLPGLGEHVPPGQAHALAMTKVLLAASPVYRDVVESEPLVALTPYTMTDATAWLHELTEIASRGWADDIEEFAPGFATVAAPIPSPTGTSTVAIGLSCSARRLASEHDELVAEVVAVAEAARKEWEATPLAGESAREVSHDPGPSHEPGPLNTGVPGGAALRPGRRGGRASSGPVRGDRALSARRP